MSKAQALDLLQDVCAEPGDDEAVCLAVVQHLHAAFGLTTADARADDNAALGLCAQHGNLTVLRYLHCELGLTAEDARANNNEALRESAEGGHVATMVYFAEGFGLTRDDAVEASVLAWCIESLALDQLTRVVDAFGFTTSDAREGDPDALTCCVRRGDMEILQYVVERFGLGKHDACRYPCVSQLAESFWSALQEGYKVEETVAVLEYLYRHLRVRRIKVPTTDMVDKLKGELHERKRARLE